MEGLRIDSVGITPNPVNAGNQIKISVGVSSDKDLAFVGRYIGVYVHSKKHIFKPLAYVNSYVKEKEQ